MFRSTVIFVLDFCFVFKIFFISIMQRIVKSNYVPNAKVLVLALD